MHTWFCTDTPGIYDCECGAIGYFNRETQQIEMDE